MDLIDEIGPEGQWMDADHTRRHLQAQWYPAVFDRGNYEQWQARGGKTLGERAAAKVDKILASHHGEALPEDIQRALHAVVERAETQFVMAQAG